MLIGYSDEKVQRLCESEKESTKQFGKIVTKQLVKRLSWLGSASNLEFFNNTYRFLRLHKLDGQYDGMFAIDINDQFRLIFYPCNENNEPDTESDFKTISIVTIQEVSKHYE